jgi:pilus assembly protein CpaB
MLCFALVCGGLAASQVHERERRAEAAVGPLVGVVVAERQLTAGRPLRPADLAVRRLPVRFVPPDALGGERELVGARLAAPVAAGSYVTAGLLQSAGGDERVALRPGERAVEVAVGGGSALAGGPSGGSLAGARVDVVVSTAPGDAGARTFIALEHVELLALRAGGEAGASLATLRVTARQAVYLTAAANYAHELRLLVRPPGDRSRVGASAVAAGGL